MRGICNSAANAQACCPPAPPNGTSTIRRADRIPWPKKSNEWPWPCGHSTAARILRPDRPKPAECQPPPTARRSPATDFRPPRAQSKRKMLGRNPTQIEIDVGDRQRATPAIASRSRIGPGAVGPDHQLHAVESADRAAAGRHGFDGQHRSHDADAGLFGFVLEIERSVEPRNVGARSTHVEADRPRSAGRLGHARKPDHPSGRPRQDAVLAGKLLGRDQSTGRSQNLQFAPRQRLPQGCHVVAAAPD